MLKYVLNRIAMAVVTVWAIVTLTFFLSLLAPGDPSQLTSEHLTTPAARMAWKHNHGRLDLPPIPRYFHYMAGVLHGDLGRPFHSDAEAPVTQFLVQHFPVTALLAGAAMAIAVVVGLLVGLAAALKRDTWFDRALMTFVLAGVSIPNFVLGPIAIALFSLKLGWLPEAGWGDPADIVLPALVLAARPAALIARMARSSMIETLGQEYIRAARARGLSGPRVVLVHALKNALLPVLTSAGVSFGYLLSGSFVVESVFDVPGVGQASFASIGQRDYSLIQGTTILLATIFVVVNLVIDLLYAAIDPRIRLTGTEAAS